MVNDDQIAEVEKHYERVTSEEPDYYSGILFLAICELFPEKEPSKVGDAVLNAYAKVSLDP